MITIGSGSVTFWDLTAVLVMNANNYILVNDLDTLAADIASNPSGNYALSESYDATLHVYNAPPIPTVFNGHFDGLGNAITNLDIQVTSGNFMGSPWLGQAGLLAALGQLGIVKNLNVTNATVTGGDLMNVGVIVGELSGIVDNCNASGSAHGGNGLSGHSVQGPDVGGIAGAMFNAALIISSHSDGTVTGGGTAYGGGIVGGAYQNGDQIAQSYSSATLTTGGNALGGANQGSAAGGLVGLVYGNVSVEFDNATGNVTAGDGGSASGGLIGEYLGDSQIESTYATGTVTVGDGLSGTDPSFAGGLVGSTPEPRFQEIDRSFANGSVNGGDNSRVGGLVGSGGGASFSYATGAVAAKSNAAVGGLIGITLSGGPVSGDDYSIGNVATCSPCLLGGSIGDDEAQAMGPVIVWNINTSGRSIHHGAGNVPDDPGLFGLTMADLKNGIGGPYFSGTIWSVNPKINHGFPYLNANPPPRGNP